MLDGMFSFVLLDTRDKSFIAARDAIGITPLYMGWGLDGMQHYPHVFYLVIRISIFMECLRFVSLLGDV